MSGRFTDDRVLPTLATASQHGLLAADDYALLHSMRVPVSRLSYAPSSDLLSAAAISATTWTDVSSNQNFTVGSATAQLRVEVRLKVLVTSASVSGLGARVVFNSGGTPQTVMLGGGVVTPAGGWGTLGGATFVYPAGVLPVGTNTVKVQMYSEVACTAYCRLSSAPNVDVFVISIAEITA